MSGKAGTAVSVEDGRDSRGGRLGAMLNSFGLGKERRGMTTVTEKGNNFFYTYNLLILND